MGVGCVGVVAGPGFPVLADTCRGSGPHAFTCRLSTGAVPVEWPLGRVNTSPQGWMSAPGNGGPRISEPVHATDRGRPNHDKPATPQPQPLTRTRKPVARSLSPDACSSTPLSMVTRRGARARQDGGLSRDVRRASFRPFERRQGQSALWVEPQVYEARRNTNL